VLVVGLVDYADGPVISFGVFYLLPVIAVTVLVGPATGLLTAAISALAWVIGDMLVAAARQGVGTHVWNGALRVVALSVIVLLLTGLLDALEAARASDRHSREFLADAAHQLRTPVAGLRASAEALLVVDGAGERERLLGNLTADAGRAGRLVASLLRIARLDQGEAGRLQPLDMRALCADELEPLHAHRGAVGVSLNVDASVPSSVMLDPEATRETLANLLDNARRHAVRTIELSVSCTGDRLQVAVSDDGPGLPTDGGERAFERFVTLDGRGGAGLGLAIARGLARRQGGDLVYRNGVFLLQLPVEISPNSRPS
jgi:signal transduction histidine kinase